MTIEIGFSSTPPSFVELDPAMSAEWYRERAIEALLNSGELTPELILQLAQSRLDDLDGQVQDLMAAMAATTENARAAGARLNGLRDILTKIEPALNPDGTLALGRDRLAVEIEGGEVQQTLEQFVDSEVAAGRISRAQGDMILADTDGSDGIDGLDVAWNDIEDDGDRGGADDMRNRFIAAGFADPDSHSLIPGHVATTPLTVDRFLRDEVAAGRITEAERVAIVSGGRTALNNLVSDANTRMSDINSQNEMMMIKLQSAMQNRTTILTSTTNLLKAMDEGNDAIVANLR